MSSSQLKNDFTYSQLTNTLQPDAQSLNPTEIEKTKVVAPDQTIQVANVLGNFTHR
jgi:hypothetical protein